MRIGIINESEKIENRVALIPASVSELVERGHSVYFQSKAGDKAGYSDQDYLEAGGKVVYSKEEIFGRAEIDQVEAYIQDVPSIHLQKDLIGLTLLIYLSFLSHL